MLYKLAMELNVHPEISLKQISRIYADDLHNLVAADFNEDLCYWCPDLKTTYQSLASTIAHIDDANSKFAEDNTPDFLIFYKNKLAGLISLSPIDRSKNTCEIGYWLGRRYVGYNIVTRVFPALLTYATETLLLDAVELSTAVPNIRSQRLPEKFSFQKIRIVQNAEELSDRTVDHILWRLEFYHPK
jgi:RimJ/RimL family protein N-acetyltransferase